MPHHLQNGRGAVVTLFVGCGLMCTRTLVSSVHLRGGCWPFWEYRTLHATTTFEWACWLPSPSWLRHDRSLKSHAPTCVTAVSSRVTHVPRGQWLLGNQTNYIAFHIWPSLGDFLILHFFFFVLYLSISPRICKTATPWLGCLLKWQFKLTDYQFTKLKSLTSGICPFLSS